MHTLRNLITPAVGALAFVLLFAYLYSGTTNVHASVPQSNEYMSTTTFAASAPAVRLLKNAPGSLAQVTITGANTGLITLYDATTSNITLRASTLATSSLVIADFPASAAAGTYTFDASVQYGLLLVTSGSPATSTITYR